MLQRIQTLYLLIALLFSTIMLISPLAEFIINGGDIYYLSSLGIYPKTINNETNIILHSNYLLFIINLLILTLTALVIVLYKRRKLQMQLAYVILASIVVNYGLIFFYFRQSLTILNSSNYSFKITVIFPALAIILVSLAIMAIRKDEDLIKSVDRLR